VGLRSRHNHLPGRDDRDGRPGLGAPDAVQRALSRRRSWWSCERHIDPGPPGTAARQVG
jgi:hypothetical protein